MQRMFLPSKTGFKILKPEKPVVIRDKNGMLFYSTEYKTPDISEFNLPAGEYYIDQGNFRSMFSPINYPLMPLPKKERNRKTPTDFKILWGDNPDKCSIDWINKTITFDHSLKDYSKPERDFIKYHEFSHADYKTEKYCDLKAANYMIANGYNPIQIGISQIDSLSPKQVERKEFLTNALIRTYGKKYL